MDVNEAVGLRPGNGPAWGGTFPPIDQRQARRRATDHAISIPTGIVLELAQAAEDLRRIAVSISTPGYDPAGTRAEALRRIAVTLQTVSEQANT